MNNIENATQYNDIGLWTVISSREKTMDQSVNMALGKALNPKRNWVSKLIIRIANVIFNLFPAYSKKRIDMLIDKAAKLKVSPESINLSSNTESINLSSHMPNYGPGIKAPFILVRSDNPGRSVAITLSFNESFKAVEPTFPKPSVVTDSDQATWKVTTQDNDILDVEAENKTHEKVNLIWWEAQRNKSLIPVNVNTAACIRCNDTEVRNFLSAMLTKRGVKPSEQTAFLKYWSEVLCQQTEKPDYLLVQFASEEEIKQLLPSMKVESDQDGDKFELNRFYFRFVPTAGNTIGLDSSDYVEKFDSTTLAPNTVIDLGGEIVTAEGKAAKDSTTNTYNQNFIETHIKV